MGLFSKIISFASLAVFAAGQTNFTGDIISGYPVITSLDLSDVPSNAITRYWLLAAEATGGISYFLPVLIARGSEDSLDSGRKLSLSAAIHGDELHGIPIVQRVFARLNETVASGDFNGTVIGLPTSNTNGNLFNQRNFYSSEESGFLTNLNRVFPGESVLDGAAIPDAYAFSIWNNLWGNTSNVDVAVDMHTSSIGVNGPFWAYGDYRLPYVGRLAELAEPDIIKIDPGQEGTIETTWVENSVPAITLEIGLAKYWNQTMISRAENYIFRLLEDLKMLPNSTTVKVDLSNTYKATNFSDVIATRTGWLQMNVDVLEDVEKGQEVGVVINSWGDVVEKLTSSVAGRVVEVRTDPSVEQGVVAMTLVYNDTSTE